MEALKPGNVFSIDIEGALTAFGVITKVCENTYEGFWFAQDDEGEWGWGPTGTSDLTEITQITGYMTSSEVVDKLSEINPSFEQLRGTFTW